MNKKIIKLNKLIEGKLSMGFPGKNSGVGCHFLLQGNLSNPEIELVSSALAGFPGGASGK